MTGAISMDTYTAFEGSTLLTQGDLKEVVLEIKKRLGSSVNSDVLIFSDATGKTIDFNFQGSKQDVLKRLEVFTSAAEPASTGGPGRPKLGVVSREVSLLPRHWEWLATQPGGASATLRLLVEEARKRSAGNTSIKQVQERTYQVMSVLAGDLQGYEEALRALYKRDRKAFFLQIQTWPQDVQKYLSGMTKSVFAEK
jgi:uncharacterized protein